MTFAQLWAELLPVGRDELTGGYRRYSWTAIGCRLPGLVRQDRDPARAAHGL